MEGIVEALTNIVEFLQYLFGFIGQLITELLKVLSYTQQIIPTILGVIITLPSWLISFCMIGLGVSIAYIILGRESGKS